MESQQSFTLDEAMDQYMWNSGGQRALVHISDAEIEDFVGDGAIGKIAETINKKGIDYIAVGTSVNSQQFADLLRNTIQGTLLDGTNTNTLAERLADLLWARLQAEANTNPQLLTPDDLIGYMYTYSDPENDPVLEEQYLYRHDISGFDINTGLIDGSWSEPFCIYLSTIGMTPYVNSDPPIISFDIEKTDTYKQLTNPCRLPLS